MLPLVFGSQKNFMIVSSETDKGKKYRTYREFQFITRGKILKELFEEGLTNFSFSQLHRFEKKGIIPIARRTGGAWRVYSREEADKVKELVWKWYGGQPNFYLEVLK